MIYFLTALYYEAEDIISHYRMKKVMEASKFQVFKGENELLVVSGTSGIKAVVAATYLLNNFKYNEDDIFVNVGICGAVNSDFSEGEIILCNKLIDSFSKKAFYPDILFRHSFNEGTLESFACTVGKDTKQNIDADIVDEEGTFVYEAVSMFLKPHNIHVIKIVSDILSPGSVTPAKIKDIMAGSLPEIYHWLEGRTSVELQHEDVISAEEYGMLNVLVEKMKLTTAMNRELEKLSRQYKIRNGHIIDVISEYTKYQCKSKNEGKKSFGELRYKLMEL